MSAVRQASSIPRTASPPPLPSMEIPLDAGLSFDPYEVSYGLIDPRFTSDFSSISLQSPADGVSSGFLSESADSPASPVSPVLSNSSYGFPTSPGDFSSWAGIEQPTEGDTFFRSNRFQRSSLSSASTQTPMLSPAINPMDLAIPTGGGCTFGSPALEKQLAFLPQPSQAAVPAPAVQAPATASLTESPAQVDTESAPRYPSRSLKRKTSASAPDTEERPRKRTSVSPPPAAHKTSDKDGQPPKKAAHNMIEKRYRNNLNDKITQLRDSVPALRITALRYERPHCEALEEALDAELGGSSPLPKLNKATILTKACEYIAQLESRNRGLETENVALRDRMEGLEMLVMGNRSALAAMWS